MSKQYRIKWRESDQRELTKVVKNFNAKITRLQKKDPMNKAALPAKVSVKELKELIQTRQDLKREINALKRFSRRGAEELVDIPDNYYNLKITKWQKQEMARRVGVINRKRKKRKDLILETEQKQRGKELGYTKAQIGMGSIQLNEVLPMKVYTPKMEYRDLRERYKSIQKQSQSEYWTTRDMIMRESYLKSLENNFSQSEIDVIYKAIQRMDIGTFLERYYQYGGNFETNYPMNEQQRTEALEELGVMWL